MAEHPADDPADDHTGCLVLITDRRGRVLLQLRDDIPGICWPGHWVLPGGRREPGETWAQTAIREVFEETGIRLASVERAEVEPHASERVPPPVFRASFDGDEADLVLGEGQELRFVHPDGDLPEPIPPHIRHYIARRTASAEA
ncbi:NUDIX domain-containing protein [Nocardiopsis composta]|uniref:8-oxo-dGTP diphosphatase n=1 Tax=Nocardiopsis composta TaxID=157465 RepID=A0A7W8VGP2_9ACTN|nr:NUDIX domain-containing protein [Nocardiopsis composta]MBB5435159.1 8-oxo-dGTP diphosphatase [Nocardiopsis composta]